MNYGIGFDKMVANMHTMVIGNGDMNLGFIPNVIAPSPGITLFGGSTSGGKTMVIVNAMRELLEQGHEVLFISYEQPEAEIYTMLCLSSMYHEELKKHGVLGWKARSDVNRNLEGLFTVQQGGRGLDGGGYVHKIIEAFTGSGSAPAAVVEQDTIYKEHMDANRLTFMVGRPDTTKIAELLKEMSEEDVYPVIIIDNLQYMPVTEGDNNSRRAKYSDITKRLIDLSSQHKLPIIASVHITHEGYIHGTGKDARKVIGFNPQLEQIRGADSLGQAASLVITMPWVNANIGTRREYFFRILKSKLQPAAVGMTFPNNANGDFYYIDSEPDVLLKWERHKMEDYL